MLKKVSNVNGKEWIERARKEIASLDIEEIKASGILPDNGNQYFPVIGYPPLTMFSPMTQAPLFDRFSDRPNSPTIAYIHIPFCPSQCTFCHWITKTKSRSDEVDDYLTYLDREMEIYKNNMGVSAIPARSVLVGGGTPTYLSPAQMERFLQSVTRHFDLSQCTQFSVEAEPTTLLGDEGLAKLRIMKEYGVHRISMGVQSFDDPILAYMGRIHKHDDTLKAIEQMRNAGIENIFIDLIYAYPSQTLEMWVNNMLAAVSLDVDGWQLYRLRIKKHGDRQGNIIKVIDKKPERFPDADELLLMKYLGIHISEEYGYGEHQTRIFARKPNDISHYLRDWCCELTDVVGVGVSSWSNLRGVFTLNIGDANLEHYYDYMRQGQVAVNRGKIRSRDDELRRSFILPLKNMKVSKRHYQERTGVTVESIFNSEITWLKGFGMIDEDDQHVWLTQRGRFFADEISTQFFNRDYLPFPEVVRAPSVKTY